MAYYPVYYQYAQGAVPVIYLQQHTQAYNPQFNGWDTIHDMPIYDKVQNIQQRT
jgi:hypothetical protein